MGRKGREGGERFEMGWLRGEKRNMGGGEVGRIEGGSEGGKRRGEKEGK